MIPVTDEIRNGLLVMHRHIRLINTPDFPSTDETPLSWHNERQQGKILLAWERLAAHLGEHGLAAEAGLEMIENLAALPRSTADPGRRAGTQDAMRTILKAADGINNGPEEPEEQLDPPVRPDRE